MGTKWVVTVAAERIPLDATRTGETTFTVTNPNGATDRAVFDPVVGDGADPGWFTVDEPQRLVRSGASVSYRMTVAVPATVPPGTYTVQGRVYSAQSAPEESSVLSPRVLLDVPDAPAPAARRRPWRWWPVAAGLVVALLIGIGLLGLGGGGRRAAPDPDPAGRQAAELEMPDLLGMSERDALRALSERGLTARPTKYRHSPDRAGQVVAQSIEAGRAVPADAAVDVEVAIALTAPTVTGPVGVPLLDPGAAQPTLRWDGGRSPAHRWQIMLSRERCFFEPPSLLLSATEIIRDCHFPGGEVVGAVDATSWTPNMPLPRPAFGFAGRGHFYTGWVQWQVAALDDFGTPGPASEPAYYRVALR